MKKTSLALASLLALAACGDKDGPKTPPRSTPPSSSGTGTTPDHAGQDLDLGRVTVAGHEFALTRVGDLVPGKEGAFEASLVQGPAGADLAKLNVYLWVEEQGGSQVSAPSKGSLEKGKLHFHVTPRKDGGAPVRVVLRLRADGGIDERGSLPLSGHGHEHGATPHDGIVAAFHGPDGQVAGHLELKLHDDKGDLELWIAKDPKITQPMDAALDTVVRVTFIDFKDRTVELRVRNRDKNEDEEGAPNVRSGRTNYFIFPGDSGQDAAWLVGAKFQSVVRVTFTVDGQAYTSEEFVLAPHTHGD